VRGAITLLIVGSVIVTLGSSAVFVSALRRRVRERFLLWFGLFSILYGIALVVRNSAFRLGFGQPQSVGLSVERLLTLSIIVPGLLLFEEFYGRGWRSSVRWVSGIYCALVAVALSGVVHQSPLEFFNAPGTALVIMVPVVLTLGRIAGYRPPPLAHSRVLFAGLLAFFSAYSIDRVRHATFGNWHSGVEPYGFLVLVICLCYVTAQRVIKDERRLVSLSDEMRAATIIQEAILPASPPSLENVQIAVRYAPMTAVAGDLYDFPAVRPNCIAVFVADVMGHGVPAALVASMVKVAVSTQRESDGEPASMIARINGVLCNETRKQYATAVYLCLDAVNRAGRYSTAAHPPPLLWRRGKQALEVLGATGLLLGVRANEAYADSKFSFDVGDRLLLYTDGLLEAENAAGESFGDAALPTFIKEKQDFRAEQFVDLLLKQVLAWSCDGTRERQEDDITIMVIDFHHRATT
jgi:sigma-B regulation protein RsbU (phosphoserine phosphatase)